MTHRDYIVGVDEAGRGPLAGPVAVCAVLVPKDFDFSVFPHLDDSKKMTEKRREEIFEEALKMQYDGKMRFAVQFSGPETIDTHGIERATEGAVNGVLFTVGAEPLSAHVMLDGRLKAPEGLSQETIVGGDATVPVISLASVIAKVARDRLMVDLCKDHPEYGFSNHKGYGTKAHIEAIQKNGTSPIHRQSFLSRIAPEDEDV